MNWQHPSQKFLLLIISFVLGVASVYYFPTIFSLSVGMMVFIFLILFIFGFKPFLILLLLFFLIGGKYYLWSWGNSLEPYYDKYVEINGQISNEVDRRIDHQKLTVKIKELQIGKEVFLLNSKILIKVPLYPKFAYGDILLIKGKLQKPDKIENFNYEEYLARYNIYGVMYNASVHKVSSANGNKILSLIFFIKHKALSIINQLIPEPHAAFLAGILLGDRKGLSEFLKEAFNRTGLTHIIAVSGYNITIISTAFMVLAFYLGLWRRQAIVLAIIGIIFFMILTGASAAVVRAAIMGIIVLLSKYLGRNTSVLNLLCLTVFIMLLFNPKILLLDVGFQLSFLATIALIYLVEPLEKKFSFLTNKFALKESFTTTLAAIIFTTPLILYIFKRFSVVAILVNLLVLPVIPLAMLLGALMLLVAFFSMSLASVFAFLVYLILEYIIVVVSWASSWNYAVIKIQNFSQIIMLSSYIIIFLLLFKYHYKKVKNEK